MADDIGLADFTADVNLENFVAEATFVGDAVGVGFILEPSSDAGVTHSALILESGTWRHGRGRADETETAAEGELSVDVNFGENRRVHVQIAMYSGLGMLFVNGSFQTWLDFSRPAESRTVDVTAYAVKLGRISVRLEDFTISPIDADAFDVLKPAGVPTPTPAPTPTSTPTPAPVSTVAFGPESGRLPGYGGNQIFPADATFDDFVVESTFVGDALAVGFLTRFSVEPTGGYSILIFPWEWRHSLNSNLKVLAKGAMPDGIESGANRRVHIRVAAHGGLGMLFINGAFQAWLDLSHHTEPGYVMLVASSGVPLSIRFEDFTVTPIDAVAFEAMKPAGVPAPTP